jgi:hypothetical protein
MEKVKRLSKKQLNEKLKEYQGYYPKKKLFYTEDGNFFIEKSPAVDYATKTKQKWFDSSKNGEEDKETEEVNDIEKTDAGEEGDEPKND